MNVIWTVLGADAKSTCPEKLLIIRLNIIADDTGGRFYTCPCKILLSTIEVLL